ncbi:hypothetical protein L7F22_029203 [Adiantum nelumboides]|nr:hypothetical protein [Adiantum nelumboides]
MFMKEKQKESSFRVEPSRWEFYSRMGDLLGGTPKVSGLNDGLTGEEFVIPEVMSLAEDEDMVAGVDDEEGGLPQGEEDEASILGGVPTNDSTPSNVPTTTINKDGVPGPVIGQSVRGQRVKKQKMASALEGLGASMERGVCTFTKAFERVEI